MNHKVAVRKALEMRPAVTKMEDNNGLLRQLKGSTIDVKRNSEL
jgi:hypothetical protein